MLIGGEVILKIKLVEIVIVLEFYEKNCVSYEDKQKQEEEECICMVMEYIYFVMFCIVD